jgi:hypothetical protein
LFPVSDVSCYRSFQVARFLVPVNELRKGKDAAAERLCSTCAQRMPSPDCRHDGAGGFASGHRLRHQTGHGIPCAVVFCLFTNGEVAACYLPRNAC